MARINIPAPISTYRDLGSVELSKLARNQYIEGYSAADEFENSVSNMQSLEKDAHLKTKLSNQYSGMLDKWSSRGDYETLGIAINKGANQFVRDYAPVQQSVKNREEYQKRLRDAYDKKHINANTYQGRMAQSDAMYQGIQYGEDGQLMDQSVYGGKEFYNDVDISEKINKRLKELKPFIRQNLGTQIPYNEDMEITTTQGDRGEPKYWVTTKSKTVQLPDNIIQSVVNDVMQDPDVSASLAQGIELQTYQLSDEDASGYIGKLIESGDIKEEEIGPMVEQMGPLVALQNIMYQDEVSRETNLALGAFGGVRESSSGRTMKYDAVWKQNNKAKLDNAAKSVVEDDLSYSTEINISPQSTDYKSSVEVKDQTLALATTNLAKVTNHHNVNPDNIEYNEDGSEIFGSGGEGHDIASMTPGQIISNAEIEVDAWRTASQKANTTMLQYSAWRNLGNHSQPKTNEKGTVIEGQETYLTRLDDEYKSYQNDILNTRAVGTSYLNNVAGANDLDIDQYNNILTLLSGNTQTIDAIDSKINSPVTGLVVPNSFNEGDLTVSEYTKKRGNQLLKSSIGTITGQDMVDAYNSLVVKYPDSGMTTITHPHEIPVNMYSGNLWNNMATNYKDVNTDGHELINALAQIKSDQGDAVSYTYVEPLGGWQWDQSAYENGSDFRKSIEGWFGELTSDNVNSKSKYKAQFNKTSIPMSTMVITNMGANYSTMGNVKKQLDKFLSDDVLPANFAMRETRGQSGLGFETGFINSNNSESNHFGYNVTYDIVEDQAGPLNMELGDEGPMILVPIKITNSPPKVSGEKKAEDLKGKVYSMLIPAHYFNIPALTEYVNSPEMEVNTQWNKGVYAGLTKPWSPRQYSNVTFDYQANTVTISGEEHSKEKGLSILVQNLINNRGRRHQE